MTLLATCALLLTFLPATAVADDHPFEKTLERSFVSGGDVRLDLSAGAYMVRRGADDRIRVTWRTRTEEQLSRMSVVAEVRGREATIVTSGLRGNVRVVIELPARTDLRLRMSAGELDVRGLEGNKDIRLRAGELDIEIAEPTQYREIDAAVTVGDLNARPFGVLKGGLFRSFSHEGAGRYLLRARLWAGELRILSRDAAGPRR